MNRRNLALERSLSFLSQPISLAAILLLFLNDHVFRTTWPSWIFGKLGDLAWLFIFPPLLIIPLSIVFRPRSTSQSRHIGMLAYGVTAVIFSLANLIKGFNTLLLDTLELFFGSPFKLVSDPTDVFTVIALIFSWKQWNQNTFIQQRKWVSFISIPFIVVLTVANSGMPDRGIDCFNEVGGEIYTEAAYRVFKSMDGGMSWNPVENHIQLHCGHTFFNEEESSKQLQIHRGDLKLIYRFQPGNPIELSEDNGSTWTEVYPLDQFSEAESVIYTQRWGASVPLEGPFDAFYDEKHGNLIFAMGHQGVLVLDSLRKWTSVEVGEYIPYSSIPFSKKIFFLQGEILVSIGIGLLLFQFMSMGIIGERRQKIIVGVSCAIFIPVVIIFRPISLNSYTELIGIPGYLISTVLIVAGFLETITRFSKKYWVYIQRMIVLCTISMIFYFVPLVLWIANIVPYYLLAQIVGFSCALILYMLWKKRISQDSFLLENAL